MISVLFSLSFSRLKYGIMCDAGSSGTRAYIYMWESDRDIPNVRPAPDVEHAYEIKLHIPLASAAKDDTAIETIFSKILEYCNDKIPKEYIPTTRFFVFATAGMRLLPQKDQDVILDKTYEYLLKNSPYKLKRRYIRVISGIEEGVYGWISVNHLLGNFENHLPTVGALDMGGASFQIAIEVPDNVKADSLHKVSVGKKSVNLFAHSYLGYGVNQALLKISTSISSVLDQVKIENPCIQKGFTQTTEGIESTGTGNFTACSRLVDAMLVKSAEFSSIQIPNLEYIKHFVAMASLYYVNNFFKLPANSSLKDLKHAAIQTCETPWSELEQKYKDNKFASSYCWYGIYQYNILAKGYRFKDGDVLVEKQDRINGIDLSWTTGAMLSEVAEIEIDDKPAVSILYAALASAIVFLSCFGIVWFMRKRGMRQIYAFTSRRML